MIDNNTELISEFLFGDLTDERRRELELEIEASPELAAEVAQLAPIATHLEAMPPALWDLGDPPPLRLERDAGPAPEPAARGAKEKKAKKTTDSPGLLARFFGGSLSLRPAYALAAVMMIFVGGIGVGVLSDSEGEVVAVGPIVQQTNLAPVGDIDPGATGNAAVKRDGELIRLKMTGLKANHDNNFYEAWLMDEKNGLVSLGTFRVGSDGTAVLDLPVAVGTDRFPVVDISLQPVNGKPDHSGVSVLRGTLN